MVVACRYHGGNASSGVPSDASNRFSDTVQAAHTPGGPYLACLLLMTAERRLLPRRRDHCAEKLARSAYVQLCCRAPVQQKLAPAHHRRSQRRLHVRISLLENLVRSSQLLHKQALSGSAVQELTTDGRGADVAPDKASQASCCSSSRTCSLVPKMRNSSSFCHSGRSLCLYSWTAASWA